VEKKRRFSCSVRSEQGDAFARRDSERHVHEGRGRVVEVKGEMAHFDRLHQEKPRARMATEILSALTILRTNETAITDASDRHTLPGRGSPGAREARAPHAPRLLDEDEEVAVQEGQREDEHAREARPPEHVEHVGERSGLREKLDGGDAGGALERHRGEDRETSALKED
jgi:hypothetical protein